MWRKKERGRSLDLEQTHAIHMPSMSWHGHMLGLRAKWSTGVAVGDDLSSWETFPSPGTCSYLYLCSHNMVRRCPIRLGQCSNCVSMTKISLIGSLPQHSQNIVFTPCDVPWDDGYDCGCGHGCGFRSWRVPAMPIRRVC